MNKGVPLASYPGRSVPEHSAEILTDGHRRRQVRRGDLMPNAMNNRLSSKSIVDYVQNPGNLDTILTGPRQDHQSEA